MGKASVDRVIDRFSFADAILWVVFAHFLCLQLWIDEAEIGESQMCGVFASKAVNLGGFGFFEDESLQTRFVKGIVVRIDRVCLESEIDRCFIRSGERRVGKE